MLLSSLLLCADPSSLPVSVPSSCRKPGLGVRKWSSCLSLFPDGLCDGRILSSYSSDLLHFVLFEEKRETRFCYLSKALSVDRTVQLMQWANGTRVTQSYSPSVKNSFSCLINSIPCLGASFSNNCPDSKAASRFPAALCVLYSLFPCHTFSVFCSQLLVPVLNISEPS